MMTAETVVVEGQEYRVRRTVLVNMPYQLTGPLGGTVFLVRLASHPALLAFYRYPSKRKVRFTDAGGDLRVA